MISILQSYTAIGPSLSSFFSGTGGYAPYSYAVLPGGIGGSITASGVYTAPATAHSGVDQVKVTDITGATATAQILVGGPLFLLCDIIQTELGLASGRVYVWDQKIMQPTDGGLFVAVSVLSCKPFGSTVSLDAQGNSQASVNMQATASIDVMSRGPDARDRKEEVLLALNGFYSQAQQEANSFYVGKISTGFVNLSNPDGAAIPYRYNVSVALQYFYTKQKPTPYFTTFPTVSVTAQA